MNKKKMWAFFLVLYILISAVGISYYLHFKTPLTGNAAMVTGTMNITIEPGNDVTAPAVEIVSPTGTVTNTTSISVYITFTDNQAIDTCWYNVTDSNNALVGSAFTQLVCSSGRDSLNVSSAGTYTIHAFANDTSGNKNLTTQGNFTAQKASAAEATTTVVSNPVSGHQTFRIQSEYLDVNYRAGDGGETFFSILNTLDNEMSFTAYLTGLEGILELRENGFTIPARTEHKLKLVHVGNTAGEYTGELVIEANNLVKKVGIAVSVSDNLNDVGLIFDYPSIYNEVCEGCEIGFSINLESSEKNFRAIYTIKDFNDDVLYRKNEIISVKDLPYSKVIKLPENMKEGQYVLFIAVSTAGKTQVASHMFDVVKAAVHEEKPAIGSSVVMVIILLVLIVVNLIMLHKTKP